MGSDIATDRVTCIELWMTTDPKFIRQIEEPPTGYHGDSYAGQDGNFVCSMSVKRVVEVWLTRKYWIQLAVLNDRHG